MSMAGETERHEDSYNTIWIKIAGVTGVVAIIATIMIIITAALLHCLR